jgi:uncharacterized protein YraI
MESKSENRRALGGCLALLVIVVIVGVCLVGTTVIALEVILTIPTQVPGEAVAGLLNEEGGGTASLKPTEIPAPTFTPTFTLTPTPAAPLAEVQPTETPAPPTDTPVPQPEAVVNAPNLNLRAGPGTEYPVLGGLVQGDPLHVLGRTQNGNWLKVVTADGQEGWVWAGMVQLHVPAETIVLASDIPVTPTAAATDTPLPTATPIATDTPVPTPTPAPPRAVRYWDTRLNQHSRTTEGHINGVKLAIIPVEEAVKLWDMTLSDNDGIWRVGDVHFFSDMETGGESYVEVTARTLRADGSLGKVRTSRWIAFGWPHWVLPQWGGMERVQLADNNAPHFALPSFEPVNPDDLGSGWVTVDGKSDILIGLCAPYGRPVAFQVVFFPMRWHPGGDTLGE